MRFPNFVPPPFSTPTSILSVGLVIALLGCGGTDPSEVEIEGDWHVVSHGHADDLTAEQQSCTGDHGLTIRSDSIISVGGVRGQMAVGDTTGTFQCVLYGETYPPRPLHHGALFVV